MVPQGPIEKTKNVDIIDTILINSTKSMIKSTTLPAIAIQQDNRIIVLCLIIFSRIVLSRSPKKNPNVNII